MEHREYRYSLEGECIMDDLKRKELLEIYKIHANLADRVSQRREGANRIYVCLLAGLGVFAGALLWFGDGNGYSKPILVSAGVVGALLSVSWFVVIRSYRQLNSGKFLALHELEEKLAYPFFKREWELLDEGKKLSRYWKLTNVETGLPLIFFILSCGLVILSLL